MDKNYDHTKHENKIYASWLASGRFEAPKAGDIKDSQKSFSIIMPPPNANDPLHVGHAMFVTVEDILARYHRLLGEAVLWLPGTDHAGIETQFVFEKKLAKEGKSRFDFDREVLYQMIWDYVEMNSGVAIDQMKKLGASADWSRLKFTLDKDIVRLVCETFVELDRRGLVYRAQKLVNYCTKCGTAYSDLEVEHEERDGELVTIDYGNGIKVATTRPETCLGDVAVAVHPDDTRYSHLIGCEVDLPLSDRKIPVIGDEMVDKEFGTGAVKITPTHDPNDWAVAERQKMDMVEICSQHTVIGENGKMTDAAGVYTGLSIVDARAKVIADLGERIVKRESIKHSIGTCYRCHRVLEPLPRSQFFISVRGMADKALTALDKGEVKIVGAGHDKILRHWLTNLKDWNVSRQIVWGIRMPVWYRVDDTKKIEYMIQIESPGDDYVQETDTFDTWFSSGQWPVVTLMTTKPGDFETYYPTSVMETAYDILPFWVMRMMMLGIEMTGKAPFDAVYLHGLVRDEKGVKMSKSKGNVINPLELSAKYGTDALRMALVMSTAPGIDSNTGESKVRGMRNFANKIWNAGRFVKNFEYDSDGEDVKGATKQMNDKLTEIKLEMKSLLSDHRVGLASEYIYGAFWHWYCDEILESAKQGLIDPVNLKRVFGELLIMLHPFVPFVTEAVWQEVFSDKGMLIEQEWPQ
jgi:valyl-tRNA synthetase